MVSQTNEQALENCIETALVEGTRYEKGDPADFDREFAILELPLNLLFRRCQAGYP